MGLSPDLITTHFASSSARAIASNAASANIVAVAVVLVDVASINTFVAVIKCVAVVVTTLLFVLFVMAVAVGVINDAAVPTEIHRFADPSFHDRLRMTESSCLIDSLESHAGELLLTGTHLNVVRIISPA